MAAIVAQPTQSASLVKVRVKQTLKINTIIVVLLDDFRVLDTMVGFKAR